jgi:broad specificity phosphatase PhoE
MGLPERVWLLRHAETSTPAIFHGAESDIGLSDLGRRQSEVAAEWFCNFRPTAVVSSGMRRAADTAGPIAAACGLPHLVEPGLHERRVGQLCGLAFCMTEGPWAETIREWGAGNTSYTSHGAESYDEVAERVLAAWQRVVSAHTSGRIVIVAHGVVCKVLLLTLLDGWGPTDWVKIGRVANLAVSELVPVGSEWQAKRLLEVPTPVVALTGGRPTETGGSETRSEA